MRRSLARVFVLASMSAAACGGAGGEDDGVTRDGLTAVHRNIQTLPGVSERTFTLDVQPKPPFAFDESKILVPPSLDSLRERVRIFDPASQERAAVRPSAATYYTFGPGSGLSTSDLSFAMADGLYPNGEGYFLGPKRHRRQHLARGDVLQPVHRLPRKPLGLVGSVARER